MMKQKSLVSRTRVRYIVSAAGLLFLSCLSALAEKDFVMPRAQAGRAYPAHDEHPMEKVTVAVDPYDMADKAQMFSVDYRSYGYLPVFFVITNDGDQPVSLSGMKAELILVNRTKLYPATSDDLVRRMAHPSPKQQVPIPVPLPGKKIKGTVNRKTQDEIEQSQFAARAVEPHSTASGFMFFDVSGTSTPLAGANFYLTGVRDAGGNELMYFEIALEKYLSAPEKKP